MRVIGRRDASAGRLNADINVGRHIVKHVVFRSVVVFDWRRRRLSWKHEDAKVYVRSDTQTSLLITSQSDRISVGAATCSARRASAAAAVVVDVLAGFQDDPSGRRGRGPGCPGAEDERSAGDRCASAGGVQGPLAAIETSSSDCGRWSAADGRSGLEFCWRVYR